MASKSGAGSLSAISPVLFVSIEGEPLCFYLPPGPTKVQLKPYIRAGGGLLCGSEEPTAILLANPENVGSLPQATAFRYVSTEYIRDCVEKNQQLKIDQYRFTPEHVRTRSAMQKVGWASSEKRGRLAYTPEEDALILNYISKRKSEVGGNVVWQTLAKKKLINRSWQSMKYHYNKLLKKGEKETKEREEENLMKEEMLVEALPAQPDPGLDSSSPTTSAQVEEAPSSPPVHKRRRSPSPAAPAEKPGSPSEPVPETESPGEQPSSKIARLDNGTEQDVLETTDHATNSDEGAAAAAPQQGAEQGAEMGRKLGILEMASREFDDSVEVTHTKERNGDSQICCPVFLAVIMSDEETEAIAEEDASPQAKPAAPQTSTPVSSLQQDGLEAQASRENATVEAACPGPVASALSPTASKAHLFVFESDTQEEESHPREGDNVASPSFSQPTGGKEALVSLTQKQLEEDKQRIRELMRQTNQDLLAVTKALLKSSGDFSAALLLLAVPSLPDGPFWCNHDDHLLMSADLTERDRLQAKYGQEGVAKRLAFLDLVDRE